MENAIINFGEEEKARLSVDMPAKDITVASDETFYRDKTILVGMDLVSNYIFIEEYAPNRQYETWKLAWQNTLIGLPVNIIQSVSDEGKSIVKCTKESLGAHHSPDLFHIIQELSKATAAPLKSKVIQCKTEYEKTLKQIEACQQAIDRSANSTQKKLGRPIDHIGKISTAEVDKDFAQQELEDVIRNEKLVKDARNSISTSYHPFDLESGQKRTPETFKQEVKEAFTVIYTVSEAAELKESCINRIDKANRMVDSMVCTLQFFWIQINVHLKRYNYSQELEEIFRQLLLPGYYLMEAAKKAPLAEKRDEIDKQSQKLLTKLENSELWSKLTLSEQEKLKQQTLNCTQLYQRSSSCVEGRNGQLSLKHHGFRQLSKRKLSSLTVVHNHFIKRADGSTAAERFFERKPRNLFEYLIDHLDYSAQPARQRKAA